MDLGVIIKDEDIEHRAPLQTQFSDSLGSTQQQNEDHQNEGRETAVVSVLDINS